MPVIRVVLAEDHPVVRMGVRRFLEREPDIAVIGEACSGDEAYQKANELEPDLLLLDLQMPGLSGIDVAKRLIEESSPVKILVLSAHDDKIFVWQTLSIGVAGYLTKDEAMDEIIEAVRGVASGEKGWVSRRVAGKVSALIRSENETPMGLTRRDLQILRKAADGKTNVRIGYELGISSKTVEKI